MNEPRAHSQCRICKHDIIQGARKCTTCGSFQNVWLQLFADLNLQSLIALVPIVTLAYAFIQQRFEPKRSDLRIALLSCQLQKVSLFASNLGNRAAIITSATFNIGDKQAAPFIIDLPADKKLLTGGETRALELQVDMDASPGGLVPYDLRSNNNCKVTIVINTVAFGDESTSPQVIQCACPV